MNFKNLFQKQHDESLAESLDGHWWSTRWINNKSWWSLTTCIWIHVDISYHCWDMTSWVSMIIDILDDHWSSLMVIDGHWWWSLMVIGDQQDESSTSLDDHWQPAFGFMLISLAIVEKSQIHFCLIFNFFNFQISAAQLAPAAPAPLRLYKSGFPHKKYKK